jgi:hypothetical protein
MSLSQSVTVAWTDPTVSGTQLPLASLLVFENDLTQSPPTQSQVGSVAPGVQTFTTGYALPPGADRTYQVQAVDTQGNKGPLSTASNAITTATPTVTDPGTPTGVGATLNP